MTTNTETVTEVTTKEVKSTIIKVRYALFIMFAEYLGYVSPLIDWAEELCSGKSIPLYKRNILKADALSIYHKMIEDCPISEVKELYMDYYDIVLEDYDKNLCHLEQDEKDNLPF